RRLRPSPRSGRLEFLRLLGRDEEISGREVLGQQLDAGEARPGAAGSLAVRRGDAPVEFGSPQVRRRACPLAGWGARGALLSGSAAKPMDRHGFFPGGRGRGAVRRLSLADEPGLEGQLFLAPSLRYRARGAAK